VEKKTTKMIYFSDLPRFGIAGEIHQLSPGKNRQIKRFAVFPHNNENLQKFSTKRKIRLNFYLFTFRIDFEFVLISYNKNLIFVAVVLLFNKLIFSIIF
jgi:hypothetical protein